ncbi:predicted protein [Plenodomus lingam JN3]|uniref:Predicted protein n=1 Tax=Leptosphaeria maculans (strain JN3 / isolate v23.1.3 / race Av1-4-5-6-7-8) TaxID=985895 RepID=E5ADZ0_LEPMJ|nr:predicted protein [Plenodomus lingam JN3]CBY01429.1 predicted protein [Plenodomus lingam JN3]
MKTLWDPQRFASYCLEFEPFARFGCFHMKTSHNYFAS